LEAAEVDIVLLDLYMPKLNGLETIRRIVGAYPKIKIVMLSMYDDKQFVSRAFQDGARGYLLKQTVDEELISALHRVAAGERVLSAGIDVMHLAHHEPERGDLTSREREILQLIVEGHTTQTVAEMLSISPHTATRHRANLMHKLNVHTQVELVRMAVNRGLVVLNRPV